MEEEIWKIYKVSYLANQYGYRGIKNVYEVSNYGRVKRNGELVKLNDNADYYKVGTFPVHVAVAELFIDKPNTNKRLCVDHIDGNTHNNRVDNLRWVTWSENLLNPSTHSNQNYHEWTKEEKKQIGEKVSEYNKHCQWVHLNNVEKFVHEDYLDYWLDDGWLLGRKKRK